MSIASLPYTSRERHQLAVLQKQEAALLVLQNALTNVGVDQTEQSLRDIAKLLGVDHTIIIRTERMALAKMCDGLRAIAGGVT